MKKDKELIVVQRNNFIKGNFSTLEIRDLKILKLLVSKVNSSNKEFESYYYITKDEVRVQKTGTLEHSFRKYLNSVYTFI